jgi:hypothetical protein
MNRSPFSLAPLGVLAAAAVVSLVGCASSTPGAATVASAAVTTSRTADTSSSPTTTTAVSTSGSEGCTGSISFANGSLPPPYHYEWDVTFSPAKATVTVQGDYDADPSWAKDFTPTAQQLAGLCDAATDLIDNSSPDDEPLPGGTAGSAEVQGHHPGRVVLGSQASSDLDAVVTPFLPSGLYDELMGKYQAWAKTHK